VAQYHVDDGVLVLVRILGVATEKVEDRSRIMEAAWGLAIGVEVCFAAGEGQALDLIPFGALDEPEVRIGISGRCIVGDAEFSKARAEPVLKMKLLVAAVGAANQSTIPNRGVTRQEDVYDGHCTIDIHGLAVAFNLGRGRPITASTAGSQWPQATDGVEPRCD